MVGVPAAAARQLPHVGHLRGARPAEARAYLAHPVLARRWRENCEALLGQPSRDAQAVFGGIDAAKLRSSATLFAAAGDGLAQQVLREFFDGRPDRATTDLLDGTAG